MSATVPVTDRLGLLTISGESVFNTANTAALEHVRCVGAPDRSGLTEDAVVNDSQRQQFYSLDPIITVKNGQITTSHYLHGISSSKPTGEPAHNSPEAGSGTGLDMLLGAIASAFGNMESGGYIGSIDLTTAPSTTTILKEADLTSFGVGQMVTWGTANYPTSGTAYESGWVKSNAAATPDTMGLLFAAAVTPTGNTVYGSHTIFVKAGQPYLDGTPASFTMRYTDQGGNQLTCTGCAVTGLSITMNHKEPALMQLTWGVASWSETETGTAPVLTAYSHPEPEAITGAAVVWGTDAATDTRIVQSISFDLGLTRTPVEDYNEEDGIAGWVTTNIEPKVSFTVYRDAASGREVDDYSGNEVSPFSVIFGSQPGKTIGLCIPQAIITALPTPASGDLITASVELAAGNNSVDTGTPGDAIALGTVCRLAFG